MKKEKIGTINTYSMGSTQEKTIKIHQPQFINLLSKKNTIKEKKINRFNENNKILEKRDKLKLKVNEEIIKENKENSFENYNELDKKILNYHKNPHEYIDYLLEKCFQQNYINSPSDEEIQKIIEKNYDNLMRELIEKFRKFHDKQKKKLKDLEDKYKEKDIRIKNKKQLTENDDLTSEPIYQGEDIKDIFLQEPNNKYNSIVNSNNNIKNNIINDNKSKFYIPRIANNVISCLNDVNINIPNKNFISIENKQLEHKDYWNNRNYFDLEKDKIKNKEKLDSLLENNYKKTLDFQNKIFDEMFYQKFKHLDKAQILNEEGFNVLEYLKNNLTEDNMFDDLFMKRLNIFQLPMEEIRRILTDLNFYSIPIKSENKEINDILKEKKEKEIENHYNQIENDIDNILLKYGKDIDKYKLQYKKEKELRNKNFLIKDKNNDNNFAEQKVEYKEHEKINNINDDILDKLHDEIKNNEKRIYYNDNPYHYKYNYFGPSIKINKKISKVIPEKNIKKSKSQKKFYH